MVVESLLFAAALIGCIGLAAHFGRTLYQAAALRAERELARLSRPDDLANFPDVAVIIPARDEGRNIGACVEAVLASDYPNLQVIVADDDSTDDTAAIAGRLAERDPRVHVVSPAGDPATRDAWVSGKSRVLWYASQVPQAAAAEWLLFLDADTRLHPDALWRSLSFARQNGLGAFSGSGIYRNPSFFGDLLEAVLYAVVFLWMPIRAVNREASPRGWLNGQMILIRGDDYRRVDGHRAIGGYAFDDLAMGHHLKREGIRYRFLPAAQLYRCLNYADFGEAMTGWKRLLAGGTPWLGMNRPAFATIAAELCLVWCLPAVALLLVQTGLVFDPRWAGISLSTLLVVQVGAALIVHTLNRIAMRLPVLHALFFPVAAALAIVALRRAYVARFRHGAFDFRGRILRPDGEPAKAARDERATEKDA